MNTVTQKLLLEIMSYANTRKIENSDIYIKKAQEKLGGVNFYIRSQNLLSWIDPRDRFAFADLEKYVIYEDFMDPEDFEEVYGEFENLFKYLPELNEIFVLKEKHIEFSPSLSKSDIQEIYHFVETNYFIDPRRITRYIIPKQK
ncbi:hypothetical protein [Chryseobacterium sp. CCH4-E10]|uniref:hypothetical protein n=1 Tax=Chryseobacterium sp. CCH4-E10 TaxID=1768758 RepID=UPI0008337E83|nr:hypothetical protein [Chryseobacterium sp. CCH4-E10]